MNERFHKAQSSLYGEMDITKLIRKLRFSEFIAATHPKASQGRMLRNFDKFCIKDCSDSNSVDSNEADLEEKNEVCDQIDDHYPGHTDDDCS